jgi:hypothetical protein
MQIRDLELSEVRETMREQNKSPQESHDQIIDHLPMTSGGRSENQSIEELLGSDYKKRKQN